jgi:hypothetical protein
MLDLTIQLQALENGIFIRNDDMSIVHKDIDSIGRNKVMVYESHEGFGDWDSDYCENPYDSYFLKDYGAKWALTVQELKDWYRYVLVRQYFKDREEPVEKYVYLVGKEVQTGQLVCSWDWIGKVIGDYTGEIDPNINYKVLKAVSREQIKGDIKNWVARKLSNSTKYTRFNGKYIFQLTFEERDERERQFNEDLEALTKEFIERLEGDN